MAKEVQVIAWCDGPHPVEKASATKETKVSIDGKAGVLDLCDNCYAVWIESLLEILQFAPKPSDDPADDIESVANRRCGDCGFVSASRAALGHHVKRHHGKSLRDYA